MCHRLNSITETEVLSLTRGDVSACGGRLKAADRVGRGPDQRAGGANVPLECFSLRIKNYLNGRAIETGGTHFD